jgi:hypothetical protein
LRQAQKLFALDRTRVVLRTNVSDAVHPFSKPLPRPDDWPTLSNFINLFLSRSTSSLSTVAPERNPHQSATPHHQGKGNEGGNRTVRPLDDAVQHRARSVAHNACSALTRPSLIRVFVRRLAVGSSELSVTILSQRRKQKKRWREIEMGIKVAKRIQLYDAKVPLANRIRIAIASVVVCYCEEVYEEGCWFVAETRNG